MVIAKQMEVRSNIKKYFDLAYDGEPVIVPRKDNKNVMIISEELYNRLTTGSRLGSYERGLESIRPEIYTGESIRSYAYTDSDSLPVEGITRISDIRTFNKEKIRAIASLKDNWNGNGAPAFSHELISKVDDLLDNLNIQPEIFPTALMTIQFEFDNSRRDHMEIEIGMDDTSEVFLVRYDGFESYEDISVNAADINRRVREFYG